MRKSRLSTKLTSLLLIVIILFFVWSPSIFALSDEPGEEDQAVLNPAAGLEDDEGEAGLAEALPEEAGTGEEQEGKEKVFDELAENVPTVMNSPFIAAPAAKSGVALMSTEGLQDTIQVNKTAERHYGLCRVYDVTLKITGTPPEVPVDVVLIIDKSGSMNERGYVPITSNPSTSQSYYVKINGSFQSVSYRNSTWRYGSSGNRRYVTWDPDGDDSSGGSTSSNNPVGKPFYLQDEHSRLHYAKEAAINFAGKVLGSSGIPGSRVALVTFSGPSTTSDNGAQSQAQTVRGLTDNLTQLTNDINDITAVGGTNTEAGFLQGRSVIANSDRPNSNKVVIMFTDGQPTASNGNRYAVPTSTDHVHNAKAIEAGKGIFEDRVADVFTIGLMQGMNNTERTIATYVLDNAQNRGFYQAPTAVDLNEIFDEISTKLGHSAKDANVVDKIGDNFELIESTLPAGVTYNSSTRIISWNPGTIVEEATLTYQVVAKPEYTGLLDTNEYAMLTYTDVNGTPNQTKTFPKPKVNVPTLLELELTGASIMLGDPIELGIGTNPVGNNYMGISGGDGNGTYTYEWRIEGDTTVFSTERNPEVSPTENTTYELTVTDSNGCIATAIMLVTVGKVEVTVEKQVTGNFADLTSPFDFTLQVGDGDIQNFSLKNGEKETFPNIPEGSVIKLKELDSDGYTVTVKVGDTLYQPDTNGVYNILVESKDVTIIVTNHKDILIDTGVVLDILPYVLVMVMAVAGLVLMVIRRRKYS